MYFSTTASADQVLDAVRGARCSSVKPRFCWSALPRMLMNTVAELQVAGHVHVVDRDQAGFADRNFAADGFADLALQQFAHALESEGRHAIVAIVKSLHR